MDIFSSKYKVECTYVYCMQLDWSLNSKLLSIFKYY